MLPETNGKFVLTFIAFDKSILRFQRFRHSPTLQTLFVSKIGDNSIDLPGANVLIQITFMYGSRRQEAQRLGRLLRPKGKKLFFLFIIFYSFFLFYFFLLGRQVSEEYNGFFYSLVSQDTREMLFSTKRQQFLIKQGYSFKIIHSLPLHDIKDPVLSTLKEQQQLLMRVLTAEETAFEEEKIKGEDEYASRSERGNVRRTGGSLSSKTVGNPNMRYVEFGANMKNISELRKL